MEVTLEARGCGVSEDVDPSLRELADEPDRRRNERDDQEEPRRSTETGLSAERSAGPRSTVIAVKEHKNGCILLHPHEKPLRVACLLLGNEVIGAAFEEVERLG